MIPLHYKVQQSINVHFNTPPAFAKKRIGTYVHSVSVPFIFGKCLDIRLPNCMALLGKFVDAVRPNMVATILNIFFSPSPFGSEKFTNL